VIIFTDGSKTENHVGSRMIAVKDSKEIHINTQRLSITCTVFQAELCGISMVVDWIQSQGKKTSSYAINVDSKAAILAIANKHTAHPLAVAIRMKTTELRISTSITFHWGKGHARLKGNERADYLPKTAASYNTAIAYDAIPIIRGKQTLEDYYTRIWNAIYVNSANASHTKLFIPTIFHRLPLSLWPSFLLTQFLTNHGSFCSYLHKINKKPSPVCNCPKKAIQTARHLMIECSLFSKDRPAVLNFLPPTSGPEVPHKYRQHHKLPQKCLPNIFKKNPKEIKLCNIPKRTAQVLT